MSPNKPEPRRNNNVSTKSCYVERDNTSCTLPLPTRAFPADMDELVSEVAKETDITTSRTLTISHCLPRSHRVKTTRLIYPLTNLDMKENSPPT